ncbi:hypothetical protein E2C01_101793 [Portunus trituberculatus]|uniref:Uncharacterized protein n=1 Tax=Portunus trituberculatus TaxID=210409 RepID=A0A5B7KMS5_PORTR|nr:hypothetical protein [Portunus trituberculatus]
MKAGDASSGEPAGRKKITHSHNVYSKGHETPRAGGLREDCVGGPLAAPRLPDSAPKRSAVTDEINITVLMSTIHHTHQAK